jgi:hypothetical protein
VGRGWNVAVGIDADAHKCGELDPVAAYLEYHIANDIGSGNNLELGTGTQRHGFQMGRAAGVSMTALGVVICCNPSASAGRGDED